MLRLSSHHDGINNGRYAWSEVSFNGNSYDAFCTEYYNYLPNNGDTYSVSSGASHLEQHTGKYDQGYI